MADFYNAGKPVSIECVCSSNLAGTNTYTITKAPKLRGNYELDQTS